MLVAKGLSKAFGSSKVLRQVSLALGPADFVCLLGPSGCGKTTLLRILCGIETADAGQILLRGEDITHTPAQDRRFGVVFQSYALFPNLTAEQNVSYGLTHLSPPARQRRAREMLDLVGLIDFCNRFPAQLSGGQQQRVALARALAPEPAILLLDEPLSALDAKVRENLRHEIVSIQRSLGVPTIMVTHDQEEALAMADRVVLMSDGVIEQESSPVDLYRSPKSIFAAQFVGRANLVPALYAHGIYRVGPFSVPARGPVPTRDGEEVMLAIRPERFDLLNGADAPHADRLAFHGQVRSIRFGGAFWNLELDCPDLQQPIWVDLRNAGHTGCPWAIGGSIGVSVPHDALHPVGPVWLS